MALLSGEQVQPVLSAALRLRERLVLLVSVVYLRQMGLQQPAAREWLVSRAWRE